MYGFYTGRILDAYEYLGCHYAGNEAIFRTFAPAATRISVIGDFNNWTEEPMNRIYDGNFWECKISNVKVGMKYKYRIYRRDGIMGQPSSKDEMSIRHWFDRLCQMSLKGEAINYYKHMDYRRKHEVTFSELSEKELMYLASGVDMLMVAKGERKVSL